MGRGIRLTPEGTLRARSRSRGGVRSPQSKASIGLTGWVQPPSRKHEEVGAGLPVKDLAGARGSRPSPVICLARGWSGTGAESDAARQRRIGKAVDAIKAKPVSHTQQTPD
ncbi:hypothetical protein GCM10029964_085310 [Kibdelosporangium lantanae]